MGVQTIALAQDRDTWQALVNSVMKHSKVKVKQSHYRPGQALQDSRRFTLPDFMTIGI